jgi:hypothetical protein
MIGSGGDCGPVFGLRAIFLHTPSLLQILLGCQDRRHFFFSSLTPNQQLHTLFKPDPSIDTAIWVFQPETLNPWPRPGSVVNAFIPSVTTVYRYPSVSKAVAPGQA